MTRLRFGLVTAVLLTLLLLGGQKASEAGYLAGVSARTDLVIVGDSLVVGTPLGLEFAWTTLLKAKAPYSVAVDGVSGQSSADLVVRIDPILPRTSPKAIVVLIGSNDFHFGIDVEGWQRNLEELISRSEQRRAAVVLCTIPPRGDRQDWLNRANRYIRSRGYPVIDFAAAVSVNRDGTVWREGLLLPDRIHPTAEGQRVMYEQAMGDLARAGVPGKHRGQ